MSCLCTTFRTLLFLLVCVRRKGSNWCGAEVTSTAEQCAGVVTLDMQGQEVRLKNWEGEDITSDVPGSGEEVVRIELLDPETKHIVRAYGRNDLG